MLKKFTSSTSVTLALAILIISQLALAQGAPSAAEAKQTLTGVVSDSMCGAKHMAKDKTAAQCTRECVKTGMDYALVAGAKVYVLKGDKTEIDKLAGKRATVEGSVSGNTVTVESIAPAKKTTKKS